MAKYNVKDTLEKVVESIGKAINNAKDPGEIASLSDRLVSIMNILSENEDELWDIERAARFLGLKPDTLRKMAAQKKIPSIRLGCLVRFHRDRLLRWTLAKESQVAERYR